MTLKDFKRKFEADLEEEWNDGAREVYANYDSFCWHKWQDRKDAEVE